MPGTNSSLFELLLELQTLDRVPRSGYFLRGVSDPESVAEHTFHLVFLVWSLARQEPGLDSLRALELALLHDLPEVRTGDLPRTVARYFPPGSKAAAERAVAADLLAPLGDVGTERLEEYQRRETPEARFVSICDKLQLLLKARVYAHWGAGQMDEFERHLEGFDSGGFESIEALVDELQGAVLQPAD